MKWYNNRCMYIYIYIYIYTYIYIYIYIYIRAPPRSRSAPCSGTRPPSCRPCRSIMITLQYVITDNSNSINIIHNTILCKSSSNMNMNMRSSWASWRSSRQRTNGSALIGSLRCSCCLTGGTFGYSRQIDVPLCCTPLGRFRRARCDTNATTLCKLVQSLTC